MNKRNYEDARLKKELLSEKRKGKKHVERRIAKETHKTISLIENWGGVVTPIIYEIKTKMLKKIDALPPLLKDIHFAWKAGKRFICRKLTEHEKNLLKKFNIYFRPVKFDINLRHFCS